MLVDVTFLAPKAAASDGKLAERTRFYLPQSLILKGDDGSYIWLVDQSQGVARRTMVTVGKPVAGGLVEVTEGMTVGSRVISRGHENLRDGQRVRVVSEESEATAPPTIGSAGHSMGDVAQEGR
jgi:multidrug efflux pump subunit AcrA (membrane-fusion protein)